MLVFEVTDRGEVPLDSVRPGAAAIPRSKAAALLADMLIVTSVLPGGVEWAG